MTRLATEVPHARVGRLPWAALGALLVLLGPALEGDGAGSRSAGVAWAQAPAYEGFGVSTPGGSGGAVVSVTNLNDGGPGSFREAVAQGQRTVVFEVGGTIELTSAVHVRGAFMTIDGFTAPPPGITLRGGGLAVRGLDGAARHHHPRATRARRSRGRGADRIRELTTSLVGHVSIHGSGDGNLDVTEGSHDITVAWSVFAAPASGKNMLIKYQASRVSLHHNLFLDAQTRNPLVGTDDEGTPATDTTTDIWNNVVWRWGAGFGTRVHAAARVNVANNLYSGEDSRQALRVCPTYCDDEPRAGTVGRLYANGNFSADRLGFAVNEFGTEAAPFAAPPGTVEDTCLAAHRVVAGAGVRPLDALDQQSLGRVGLPSCPAILVRGLYYHALRRVPADAEVQAWLAALGPTPTASTIGSVILTFFGSSEFRSVRVTPAGYAAALVRAGLGRDPTARSWASTPARCWSASTPWSHCLSGPRSSPTCGRGPPPSASSFAFAGKRWTGAPPRPRSRVESPT